ncbi:hypothetical protein [Kiloniella sp.]|uniref:hypothetical protein n=1 Tax=Kiloniella sp. TaxID=1938587 RepID=UPI003B01FAD4
MNRIIHILLAVVFVVSAPLMAADAYDHNGKVGHHGMAGTSLSHNAVSVDQASVAPVSVDESNSVKDISGLLALMDECLKVFHCSSPNTLVSPLSEQEAVSFYQHSLWSLHKSEAFFSQTPTVDLRPPRVL